MNEFVWYLPLIIWLSILLLPWQPWRTREVLRVESRHANFDLSDICVVIPARNEAPQIVRTLTALAQQGNNLRVIVVDDQSDDNTAAIARHFQDLHISVIDGLPLAANWTGKLWALQQGHQKVDRPVTVLLDADITLAPGVLNSLREKMIKEDLSLVSVMAKLSMQSFWGKLLLPAFVYFFKLLYPFALSNNRNIRFIAAAAGGCIMLRSDALKAIGGFESIKTTLIDDCALAKKIKQHGFTTWIGLTHDVQSHRPYCGIKPIWNMVSRTAFHQLKYSLLLLLGLTVIFTGLYGLPLMGLFSNNLTLQGISILSLVIMASIYLPVLRFYRLNPFWSLSTPLIGLFFLMMTWHSAIQYWWGKGNKWHGRYYDKDRQTKELQG